MEVYMKDIGAEINEMICPSCKIPLKIDDIWQDD